jgi:thiamine biosynthesis lipoprotein
MTLTSFQHEAMTTFFELTLAHENPDYARHAATAAWRLVDQLERELSRFQDGSEISRANGLARGASTLLTEDAFECLLVAADVSVATRRAFDPAYASARPEDLAPDLPPFTLDPATFTLTSLTDRLRLDLGAVGNGYALDRVAALLAEWEIPAAYLNSGGSSVFAFGHCDDTANGWPAALGEGAGYREVPLLGTSLSGSGTAVKGAHLVNPRTGAKAGRSGRVWALAPTAAQADALSTAFFVMETAEIAAFCAEHPAVGAAVAQTDDTLATFGRLAEGAPAR